MMSKDEIVEHMIIYIEEAERNQQAANLAGEARGVRTDLVTAILNELERKTRDED